MRADRTKPENAGGLAVIKPMSFDHLMRRLKHQRDVYLTLSDEDRAEVDAHNRACHGKTIEEIIAMGDHPMKRHMEKQHG